MRGLRIYVVKTSENKQRGYQANCADREECKRVDHEAIYEDGWAVSRRDDDHYQFNIIIRRRWWVYCGEDIAIRCIEMTL